MSSEGVTVQLSDSQTASCGFRHCRQPLPPPGPRGGRPFEFCPDRRWPGDKTCKQLAAAEQALTDALGETDAPTALRDATDTFADASRNVLEPLNALSNALDAVTARMQDELVSAGARAEEAETAARQAERAQADADERVAQAEQLRDDAVADARTARAESDEAQATAARATAETEAAALARARAEATAEAAVGRARTAEDENRVVRARVDELGERLDAVRQELAERTGERDTARATLDEHRARSRDLEQSLAERLDATTAQLDQARAELTATAERDRALTRRVDETAALHQEARGELAEARNALSATQAERDALHGRLADAEGRAERLDDVVGRVNRTVLTGHEDATQLRENVLRELLARDDSSGLGAVDESP